MHVTRRHLIRDGLRIAAATIASFGLFYFAMAQTTDLTTTNTGTTVPRFVCGNNICEQTLGETLVNCKADCDVEVVPISGLTDANTTSATISNICGDGVQVAPELCDKGAMNGLVCQAGYGQECSFCTATCLLETRKGPFCGDSLCQTDRENPDSCPKDCVATTASAVAFCGNSITESSAGEQCDSGAKNGVTCDAAYGGGCKYCTSACMLEERRGAYCGDGACQATFETSTSCAKDCATGTAATEPARVEACGNGVKEGVEGCDEGAKNGTVCVPTVYGESCRFCSTACALETKLGPRCGDRICQKDKEDSLKCPMDCGALPAACTSKGIATVEECEKYLATLSTVPQTTPTSGSPFCGNLICEAETGETYERCAKDCPKPPATATTPTPAPAPVPIIPEECRKAGITNADACKKYLAEIAARAAQQNAGTPVTATVPEETEAESAPTEPKPVELVLPELCRLRGITTVDECKAFLQKMLFSTASTSIATQPDATKSPAATNETNKDAGVSDACASRGATTAEECRAIVVASAIPEACRTAGAYDDESCKKLLEDSSNAAQQNAFVALECREKSIFTREACDAYLIASKPFVLDGTRSQDDGAVNLPKECSSQGITDAAVCSRYFAMKNLPAACRDAGIEESGKCDELLRARHANPACAAQGITDAEKCKEFLYNAMAKDVTCVGIGAEECAIALKERHLGKALDAQDSASRADKAVENAKDERGTLDLFAIKQAEEHDFADVIDSIPFSPDFEGKLKVMRSEAQLALGGDDSVKAAAGSILAFDADADGVPNDVEKRFGLDPNNADTDGDGEDDGEEFKKLATKGIDKAIAEGAVIGQPLTEGETDDSLTLRLAPLNGGIEGSPKTPSLSGTGKPGEVLTLYIYSDMPVVVTTTVDENGQWSYELGDTLKDGPHEVYVAINDDTGRVTRKSNPLALFITGASAATTADAATESVAIELLDAQANALQGTATEVNLTYFLLGGGVLILIALALVAAIMRQKGSGPVTGA